MESRLIGLPDELLAKVLLSGGDSLASTALTTVSVFASCSSLRRLAPQMLAAVGLGHAAAGSPGHAAVTMFGTGLGQTASLMAAAASATCSRQLTLDDVLTGERRQTVVAYLFEVANAWELDGAVGFLAVRLFDNFTAAMRVPSPTLLQLVALGCLRLAVKSLSAATAAAHASTSRSEHPLGGSATTTAIAAAAPAAAPAAAADCYCDCDLDCEASTETCTAESEAAAGGLSSAVLCLTDADDDADASAAATGMVSDSAPAADPSSQAPLPQASLLEPQRYADLSAGAYTAEDVARMTQVVEGFVRQTQLEDQAEEEEAEAQAQAEKVQAEADAVGMAEGMAVDSYQGPADAEQPSQPAQPVRPPLRLRTAWWLRRDLCSAPTTRHFLRSLFAAAAAPAAPPPAASAAASAAEPTAAAVTTALVPPGLQQPVQLLASFLSELVLLTPEGAVAPPAHVAAAAMSLALEVAAGLPAWPPALQRALPLRLEPARGARSNSCGSGVVAAGAAGAGLLEDFSAVRAAVAAAQAALAVPELRAAWSCRVAAAASGAAAAAGGEPADAVTTATGAVTAAPVSADAVEPPAVAPLSPGAASAWDVVMAAVASAAPLLSSN